MGVAIALNVGDFLVGEGYRLIGQCGATSEQNSANAGRGGAGASRALSGAGGRTELGWPIQPGFRVSEVLEIFRRKTAASL